MFLSKIGELKYNHLGIISEVVNRLPFTLAYRQGMTMQSKAHKLQHRSNVFLYNCFRKRLKMILNELYIININYFQMVQNIGNTTLKKNQLINIWTGRHHKVNQML